MVQIAFLILILYFGIFQCFWIKLYNLSYLFLNELDIIPQVKHKKSDNARPNQSWMMQ